MLIGCAPSCYATHNAPDPRAPIGALDLARVDPAPGERLLASASVPDASGHGRSNATGSAHGRTLTTVTSAVVLADIL